MCITFLPVQNEYPWPATRFICQNFEKERSIDKQKVQVVDEIKCDIWEYLVSFDVAALARYNYVYRFSSCAK